MRDMSQAKEVIRKLRLTIGIPEIAIADFHLLESCLSSYNETKNPFALTEKQAEIVLTTYNRYFEA